MVLELDFSDVWLLPRKPIDSAAFEGLADQRPRRVCFGSTHANALKRSEGKFPFILTLPFRDTIGPLLGEDLALGLYPSKFDTRVWCGFASEEETAPLRSWIGKHKGEIFIRDLLDLSTALGLNMDENGYTPLGDLEHQAKYEESKPAIRMLSEGIAGFINHHSLYGLAEVICAVPPRPTKTFDLPTELARQVSERVEMPVVQSGQWANAKPHMKEVAACAKWDALEQAGLSFDPAEVAGKKVVLLDDLYQSGATMNFVAGKLKEAGATRIFGLSVVKSRRDTDNMR